MLHSRTVSLAAQLVHIQARVSKLLIEHDEARVNPPCCTDRTSGSTTDTPPLWLHRPVARKQAVTEHHAAVAARDDAATQCYTTNLERAAASAPTPLLAVQK